MISDLQIAEWERFANAATPGPWLQDGHGCLPWHVSPIAFNKAGRRIQLHPTGYNETEMDCIPDAKFIAAARTAVPMLCEEVRRLQMELNQTGAALLDSAEKINQYADELTAIRIQMQHHLVGRHGSN